MVRLARNCNCAGATCGCKVVGSPSVFVTGIGTIGDPFVVTLGPISIAGLLTVTNSASIHFTLLGSGTIGDPYVLSGTTV